MRWNVSSAAIQKKNPHTSFLHSNEFNKYFLSTESEPGNVLQIQYSLEGHTDMETNHYNRGNKSFIEGLQKVSW